MKSGACPKCGFTKIYVIDEVCQPDHEAPNLIVPLAVSTFAISADEVGVTTGNSCRTMVGTFEAWICAGCGFTEWYAKGVNATLERILAMGRKVHVRVVEREPSSPFR